MSSYSKVLFVGAGPSQATAIKHASLLGYIPYAIDADKNACGFQYTAGFNVGDIRDSNFVKHCAEIFKVNAIVAVATDAAVPSVARACNSLGFPSISIKAADISVNKLLQRHHMKKAGLSVPKFKSFTNIIEAKSRVNEIGLPVVIKPVDASGSRGVSLVEKEADIFCAAQEALVASITNKGMVEEYIEGNELSVEGFVVNGVFIIICLSEKIRTKPPYLLDTEVNFPASLEDKECKLIIDLAKKAVKACGLNNCPVHMEIIKSKNGPIIVELAARGAGFRVYTTILPHVTGIDTIDIQLKLALGKNVKINVKKPLNGAVIKFLSPIPGTLKSVEGLNLAKALPGVQEVEVYIQPGYSMGVLKCGADRIGHILTLAKTRKEAEIQTRLALSYIKFKLE